MKMWTALGACAAALVVTASASATEVLPYTTSAITSSDPVQFGRLTRARPPSDWSAPTPFPGFINTTVAYQYQTVSAFFAPNALQDVYYEITVDDPDAVIFASAYNGTYNPAAPSVGYLGDEGSSGNYFPGDPSFFDIVVPKGGSLTLAFNSVGLPNEPFAFQVSAFSDTMYDEDFKSPSGVPEPASWALMLVGFGAVGGGMRRGVRSKAMAGSQLA